MMLCGIRVMFTGSRVMCYQIRVNAHWLEGDVLLDSGDDHWLEGDVLPDSGDDHWLEGDVLPDSGDDHWLEGDVHELEGDELDQAKGKNPRLNVTCNLGQ
ncbi:hypothetical protein [Virgibacillus ainsalahensis]